MLHSSYFLWFNHRNIWWKVQIMKPLIMYLSPTSYCFFHFDPNILLSNLFSKTTYVVYVSLLGCNAAWTWPHDVTTHNNIDIFTAVRSSNLKQSIVFSLIRDPEFHTLTKQNVLQFGKPIFHCLFSDRSGWGGGGDNDNNNNNIIFCRPTSNQFLTDSVLLTHIRRST
jgi:hypothetical protein